MAKSSTKAASKKAAGKKTASKKSASKKSSSKRETIAPNGDKRYVRRDSKGQFKESDDVGRSLSQDVKKHSKKTAKPGQGDKGDAPKKSAAKKRS